VSDLTNADLIQTALLLGLVIPSPRECDAYDEAKANGEPVPLNRADAMASRLGFGGDGLVYVGPASGAQASAAGNAADDERPSSNPEDDREHAEYTVTLDLSPVDPVDKDAAAKADIKQQAKDRAAAIREKFGRGDFAGFMTDLEALAETALTPPPAPVVRMVGYVDPSKIKGQVPQITGDQTMKGAGISALWNVTDAKTTMPTYDAVDAPGVDPDYIWPDQTGPALAAMARGANVLFWGPAGTGKTSFPQQVAARWGRSFVRVSCTEDTEASTLVGMTVPDTASGGVKWQDGQLAAAIRKPGTVILIDEPSVARPGALFVMQALLDHDRAIYIAETGEVVRCAPDVVFVLADNTNGTGDNTGSYEGTRRLNRAFLDRCALTVHLDYLAPDREAVALVARTGVSRKAAAALCKFAALTRADADKGKVSHGIGFRRLQALAETIACGVDPAQAFQLAVLETAPHDDVEPLRQLWTSDVNASVFS